ncbi:hypothetical protein FIBSPDRAFT_853290 [Athelia psychrophila]|uniref:Uncharacterized protein n=1 Tax=Athelia psychrophila TaxID=1759441 RepID=A0A166QYQ7_9AGAM|nr:hypothetical protein FIBSPDRAFT_853290 [Fibularhizoctonia sp. CBS 109695]
MCRRASRSESGERGRAAGLTECPYRAWVEHVRIGLAWGRAHSSRAYMDVRVGAAQACGWVWVSAEQGAGPAREHMASWQARLGARWCAYIGPAVVYDMMGFPRGAGRQVQVAADTGSRARRSGDVGAGSARWGWKCALGQGCRCTLGHYLYTGLRCGYGRLGARVGATTAKRLQKDIQFMKSYQCRALRPPQSIPGPLEWGSIFECC